MPPSHWHLIAESIAQQRRLSLIDCARLFALIGIAQADASVVCWETKFHSNTWRPVTAIQRAAEDRNPLTQADTAWEQLLPSPQFPSYISGHSIFSQSSAEVLTQFLGTDEVKFTTTSDSVPGVLRTFESLAACADELDPNYDNSMSSGWSKTHQLPDEEHSSILPA